MIFSILQVSIDHGRLLTSVRHFTLCGKL